MSQYIKILTKGWSSYKALSIAFANPLLHTNNYHVMLYFYKPMIITRLIAINVDEFKPRC